MNRLLLQHLVLQQRSALQHSAIVIAVMLSLVSMPTTAMCRDRDAWAASDELALRFFREAQVFKQARVLKVHHPSGRKEVASYIQNGEKRYSIFNLVGTDCVAVYRKRTRQND